MTYPKSKHDRTKHWRNEQGELHRLDGPAVEWPNGSKEWWTDGRKHRLDGPAVEWIGVWTIKEWWVNDEKMTKQQFEQHPLVIFYRLTHNMCQSS